MASAFAGGLFPLSPYPDVTEVKHDPVLERMRERLREVARYLPFYWRNFYLLGLVELKRGAFTEAGKMLRLALDRLPDGQSSQNYEVINYCIAMSDYQQSLQALQTKTTSTEPEFVEFAEIKSDDEEDEELNEVKGQEIDIEKEQQQQQQRSGMDKDIKSEDDGDISNTQPASDGALEELSSIHSNIKPNNLPQRSLIFN
ncbi:MAG: hypothetical protein EZS28_000086 [Streblomastix strix]|uniref:Uncharacterized protein n=1 Tax=Streblomastix strix TaxID=222440 RepID=A0A5J4XD06_9EUKA|nr:MAG: hypothetical protein EZS28_000086 [Streblomastix strix]